MVEAGEIKRRGDVSTVDRDGRCISSVGEDGGRNEDILQDIRVRLVTLSQATARKS